MNLGDDSTPEMVKLTKEQFNFNKKENRFSFNHKDQWGLLLNILLFIMILFFLFGLKMYAFILVMIIAGCIAYEPIRVLYMGSVYFALGLRTPEFLNLEVEFPNSKLFEDPKTFDLIRKETLSYLKKNDGGKNVIATKDTFEGENDYIGSGGSGDNQWRILSLKVVDIESETLKKDFPTLKKCLDQCPEMIACILSILEPKCRIPMHVGYYKGLMRFMLPIIVPKDEKNIWLNVNGIKYHWKEGKPLLWDDTFPHAVVNNTNETRVLFYMDVLRTKNIPWIAQKLNEGMVFLFKTSGLAQSEISKTEVKTKIE